MPAINAATPGVATELAELIALRSEARRLDLGPHGPVLATRSGGHLSRLRGRGMEFDEVRGYQPGDDVRTMDWRVTARRGEPHVKLFREERERPVWLLVDQGQSMRFGTRVAFKSVLAARAAALLAWAAAERGDRIGCLVFDERGQSETRPAARTRGVLRILQLLANPRSEQTGGLADCDAAGRQLLNLVRPGSLVFLLSDFRGIEAHSGSWLAPLGRDNEVVLVHILDVLEARPPPPGRYPVSDGHRFGVLRTGSRSPQQMAWEELFEQRRQLLGALARRYRLHPMELRTDMPLATALAAGLHGRVAGGRN